MLPEQVASVHDHEQENRDHGQQESIRRLGKQYGGEWPTAAGGEQDTGEQNGEGDQAEARVTSGTLNLEQSVDAQSLFGGFQVQKLFDARKVVAERRLFTLFANIVGVQSGSLVGRCQSHVAHEKGTLTSKAIDRRGTGIALMDQLLTLGDHGLHGFVGSFIDHFNIVRIMKDHFRVVGVLNFGVGQAISDSQATQRQFNGVSTFYHGLIALPNTVGDRRRIVTCTVVGLRRGMLVDQKMDIENTRYK